MNEHSDPLAGLPQTLRNLVLFAFLGYTPALFVFAVVTIRLFHTTMLAFIAAFSWTIFYIGCKLEVV